jgi:MoxR-like ATPase
MSLTYDLNQAQALAERLRARLKLAVRGRDEVIDLLLVALLADGHVLLEDFPGSGKTTLARALGEAISTDGGDQHIAAFRRIQFTPDLLPSDVTGTTVFEPQTHAFVFRRGPVFAHVVLADEINRTSPKVQAAMLEAMAEKQVTIDDTSHRLDELFFVIATQNPLDLAGTYPLPRPQLDRFLFKIRMTHIARADELQVLGDYPQPRLARAAELPGAKRRGARRAHGAARAGGDPPGRARGTGGRGRLAARRPAPGQRRVDPLAGAAAARLAGACAPARARLRESGGRGRAGAPRVPAPHRAGARHR